MMFEEVFKPLSTGIILPPVGGGNCPVHCECACTAHDPEKTDKTEDQKREDV